MKIEQLIREFTYNSVKLTDPNPEFTLVQVRDFYATVYPEIISADIEGPNNVGAKAIYSFRRAVGTKGGAEALTWMDLCTLEQMATSRLYTLEHELELIIEGAPPPSEELRGNMERRLHDARLVKAKLSQMIGSLVSTNGSFRYSIQVVDDAAQASCGQAQ